MSRYTREGKSYVSVTELIDIFYPFNKASFEKWCKSQKLDPEKINEDSARMGSKVSEWIDNARLGLSEINSPCTTLKESGLLRATESFLDSFEVIDTEQVVYCDEFRFAGTYDMKVKMDGKVVLCDAKTYGAWKGKYKRDSGKVKKVSYQTSMYAYADGNIKDLALVVFKTDGTYEIEQLLYTEDWKEKIKENQKAIKLKLGK